MNPHLHNIREQIRINEEHIESILSLEQLSWESVVLPLEQGAVLLENAWAPLRHWHAVADTPEIREAYQTALEELTAYHLRLGNNRALYQEFLSLFNTADEWGGSALQKRWLEHHIRDFLRSGVGLEEPLHTQYADLVQRLTQTESDFETNIVDSSAAWHYQIQDEAQYAGWPEDFKKACQSQEGRLSLNGATYQHIMTHADDRALRADVYKAYVTRASVDPYNNTDNMKEILDMRQKIANMLGYPDYNAYGLAIKMAQNEETVRHFLQDLIGPARKMAQQELDDLKAFIQSDYPDFPLDDLQTWDLPYYSEKFYQKNFALSQEELRVYFPLERVWAGFSEIVERIFGITIVLEEPSKTEPSIEKWDPAIWIAHAYQDSIDPDHFVGSFYIDLFARSNKRQGAWMDEAREYSVLPEAKQAPAAYINCNFLHSGDAQTPVLLTHDEVLTLFHEMGHGLHHVLTTVELPSLAGVKGVPWDAVELPSQLLEQWAWEKEGLALCSEHYQDKTALPMEMIEKLKAAQHFQSGLFLVRQLEMALFDIEMHSQSQQGRDVLEILQDVREQVAVVTPPDFQRFPHSFAHIFSGGYAAGYYSYLWAEGLALDVYSRFQKEGIFNPETGQRLLESIYSQGGSQDLGLLVEHFLERPYSPEALLQYYGLDHMV